MPRKPTVTEIRLENLADCLAPTLEVLNELNDAFAPPFVQPMSSTVASLLKTLQKIFIFVKAQQGGKVKQLLKFNETNKLLKDCDKELDEAKKVFEVGAGGALVKDIEEMKRPAEARQKELLELISTMSETTTTTDDSSVHLGTNYSKNSSNSFSLLPSKPKIFYGCETDLEEIVQVLNQAPPRIAILGAGGMGKTSLATATLYHQDIVARFEHRFFVSAEPAATSVELAALIGLHIGLNPGKDLTKAVVHYFSRKPSYLLILDNLETFWEPKQSRTGLEEFLSLLRDVKHLGLVICLENVLARWETEKTAILSVGYDRKSNLDASINLSLSSPRITSESKELLSLLSILPNGLSDAELVQSKLPIPNILTSKAALLATSLAYQNSNKELMEVLQRELDIEHSGLADNVHCSIFLSSFYRLTGRGVPPLIGQIQHILPKVTDHRIHIEFLIEVVMSGPGVYHDTTLSMEQMVTEGISHFEDINDPLLEFQFYCAASTYYRGHKSDMQPALQLSTKSQELAQLSGDINQQYRVLLHIARLKAEGGEYSTAQEYANEAQQLSELSADLYHTAYALLIQARCSGYLGNYRKSMIQVDQAKELVEICDCMIRTLQADIHLLKSEYIQARSMFSEIAKSTLQAEQILEYAGASRNIAYIDIQIEAATADIWKNLTVIGEINKNVISEVLEAWPVIYLAFAYKVKEKLALHKALLFLGDVFMNKDESTAFTLHCGSGRQAECMLRLGDLAHAHGNIVAAITHWKAAQPLFEQSSQTKQVSKIDSKLVAIEKAHEKALITLANLEAPNQQLQMLPSSKEESPKAVLV
ncbi:hypothetical protein C8R45DRAFT_922843 [Mycena sanguinolenta]|nr:hypothetical protein C8R45DRAFT_922843 [Mycena sanguinolenta]